jgi:hypothetical protein
MHTADESKKRFTWEQPLYPGQGVYDARMGATKQYHEASSMPKHEGHVVGQWIWLQAVLIGTQPIRIDVTRPTRDLAGSPDPIHDLDGRPSIFAVESAQRRICCGRHSDVSVAAGALTTMRAEDVWVGDGTSFSQQVDSRRNATGVVVVTMAENERVESAQADAKTVTVVDERILSAGIEQDAMTVSLN